MRNADQSNFAPDSGVKVLGFSQPPRSEKGEATREARGAQQFSNSFFTGIDKFDGALGWVIRGLSQEEWSVG